MKKRFVVILKRESKEADDAFLEAIREWSIGWWHWMPNAWLLTDREGTLSAAEIRDRLTAIYTERCLVLELRADGSDTWAGFGPSGKKSMFDWVRTNWRKG